MDVAVLLLNVCLGVAYLGFLVAVFRSEYRRVSEHVKRGRLTTVLTYGRYRIDFFLTYWHSAKAIILFVLGSSLIVVGGVLYSVASGIDFVEGLWMVWLMVVDTSRHGEERGVLLRSLTFVITVFGMLLFALMIGLISDFIARLLDQLHEGSAEVVEGGHVVILGWSESIVEVIRQLCLANDSEGGGVIAVLADVPKAEMERTLHARLPASKLLGSVVVCRSGRPIVAADLNHVSTAWARAVVVLADMAKSASQSDALVLRTVLCLKQVRRPESTFHVVAELREAGSEDLVRVADGLHTDVCVSPDVIGRIMMQCSRCPALATVFTSLLGFEGDEFYVKAWPELEGVSFSEVLFRFGKAVPIGLKLRGGAGLVLNPRSDYVMKSGDEVIVIAEDNDSYACEPLSRAARAALDTMGPIQPSTTLLVAEKFLLVGFRKNIEDLLRQLDDVVGPGTEVHLLCEMPIDERRLRLLRGGLVESDLHSVRLVHHVGNAAGRRAFESLDLTLFTSILVLADAQVERDVAASDSLSLATLLLVDDVLRKQFAARTVAAAASAAAALANDAGSLPRKSPSTGSLRNLSPAGSSRHAARAVTDSLVLEPVSSTTPSPVPSRRPTPSNDGIMSPLQRTMSAVARQLVLPLRGRSVSPPVLSVPPPSKGPTVLSEFLDSQTKMLVDGLAPNHVMSNEIVAQVLAMLAEDRAVNGIFADLLQAGGNALFIRDAFPTYGGPDIQEPNFWFVMARAAERHEIALGYIDASRLLVLNPRDKEKHLPIGQAAFKIVVLGRE